MIPAVREVPAGGTLLVLISQLEMFGGKIRDAFEEMVDEDNGVDCFEKISELN